MNTNIQKRKRSFFLESDELHKDNRIEIVVDNSGDEDSIIYGPVTSD